MRVDRGGSGPVHLPQAMLFLSLVALVSTPALQPSAAMPAPAEACTLGAGDQAWLDQSMHAWNYAASRISGIGHVKTIEAVIFDKDCVVTSNSAMNGGADKWQGRRHHGKIVLPDGATIEPQVTSFSGSTSTTSFFVMSTPSVWRAAGKTGKGTTLEKLMTAVMLHEGTHVAQMPTYGQVIGRLAERYHLPEDFSDDSIQQQFRTNAAFTASVERESALFYAASQAKSRGEAKRLVRSALRLMSARQNRWYTGKDAYLSQSEPVWLTLEGSGQWLAYRWMVDPDGGRVRPADVLPGFLTDKWWSQREGFTAFMALERLAGTSWKPQVFRSGKKTIVELLREASAPGR